MKILIGIQLLSKSFGWINLEIIHLPGVPELFISRCCLKDIAFTGIAGAKIVIAEAQPSDVKVSS